jgi:hypothetical protein
MPEPVVYLPEPDPPDLTRPRWGERPLDWYARSSLPESREVRKFLNRTLNHFPAKDARGYIGKLRQDWRSFYFELIVGRYLQVLGADIVPNAKGNNGTDVDFRATWPDGVIASIECVSKKYNQEAQAEIDRNADMATMLDEVGPHAWAISFRKLPKATSVAEFQPYLDKAAEFYATLPTAVDDGDHIPFEWTGEHGLMRLKAIPFPRGTKPNHMGAVTTWMDNSILRLKDALIDSHKRKQARGAYPPVLLAIDCPFNGPDAEDFDRALFGSSVDHRGFGLHESVGVSFNPEGMLVTDKDIPFAGVIAFLGMRWTEAADPVLYLNPYRRWKLPEALAAHETRVWTSRIDVTPAKRASVINTLGFTEYPPEDDD